MPPSVRDAESGPVMNTIKWKEARNGGHDLPVVNFIIKHY